MGKRAFKCCRHARSAAKGAGKICAVLVAQCVIVVSSVKWPIGREVTNELAPFGKVRLKENRLQYSPRMREIEGANRFNWFQELIDMIFQT